MSPDPSGPGRRRAQHPMRQFMVIGAGVTVVDVGLLLVLARGLGWPPLAADVVAIVAAAVVSWVANRAITFAGDPAARWVQQPMAFVLTAAMGGLVDVGVLAVLLQVVEVSGPLPLLAAKLPAVAAAALFRVRAYRAVLFDDVRASQRLRPDVRPSPGDVRLSVVVPAYREAGRIGGTVKRLRDELASVHESGGLEIVVVDDGSPDTTAAEAEVAGADQVVVQPRNQGKGAAVRAGMRVARGRTVAFTDADLAYPPHQLERLLAEVESGWDVVVGSRRHTGTKTLVRARRLREMGGRVINRLTYAVLLGQYRDTQCGLKAFRGDVAHVVFAKTRIDGFAFDVEVFHLVERYRLSLTEVPVEVQNSARSTVHVVRDAARLVRDLFRILGGGRKGWYDLTDAEVGALSGRGGADG